MKDVNTDVGYVNDFAKEFILIDDIKHQAVIAYTRKLQDPPNNKSVSNVKRRITACKQYWEYLDTELGLVPLNIKPPFEKLKHLKKGDGKKYGRQAWKSAELERICREPSNYINRIMKHIIWIGIMTGMRLEEICTMEVEDINVEDNVRVIHIPESKTIAGVRNVPIHSDLEWIIDELVQNTKDGYLIPSGADKYGKRSRRWSTRFGRHKTELGFPKNNLVFHSIRKYTNTMLSKYYVTKNHRQLLLGWHTDDGEDMADGVYSDAQQAYPMSKRKADIELSTSELPFIKYGSARYIK